MSYGKKKELEKGIAQSAGKTDQVLLLHQKLFKYRTDNARPGRL